MDVKTSQVSYSDQGDRSIEKNSREEGLNYQDV